MPVPDIRENLPNGDDPVLVFPRGGDYHRFRREYGDDNTPTFRPQCRTSSGKGNKPGVYPYSRIEGQYEPCIADECYGGDF